MRLFAKVKPSAKEDKVEKISDSEFILRVKAPAREGKANAAVIELLSGYFDVPKSRITIIKGHNTRNKVINIGDGSSSSYSLSLNKLQEA